jgi:Pyruvate/2-oxoacid:ferredoxin oxidoreductase delta subunit
MAKRKIIQIDESKCNGCGNCVTSCAEGAVEVSGGKARVVKDSFCDGLGACIGHCPTGALTIVEREAEAFDEEAVKRHLGRAEKEIPLRSCPGPGPRRIARPAGAMQGPVSSELGNWPIQIRLVPPTAPHLKGAKLLVAADCTAFACGSMHQDHIRGRVVLIGCPKLDDTDAYEAKLRAIVEGNGVGDILVVRMEVPCCSALTSLVRRAAGKARVEEVVISTDGGVVTSA